MFGNRLGCVVCFIWETVILDRCHSDSLVEGCQLCARHRHRRPQAYSPALAFAFSLTRCWLTDGSKKLSPSSLWYGTALAHERYLDSSQIIFGINMIAISNGIGAQPHCSRSFDRLSDLRWVVPIQTNSFLATRKAWSRRNSRNGFCSTYRLDLKFAAERELWGSGMSCRLTYTRRLRALTLLIYDALYA